MYWPFFLVVSNFAKMRKEFYHGMFCHNIPIYSERICQNFGKYFWEYFGSYLDSDFNLKDFFFHYFLLF
jgi:hypothetical protein